MAHYMLNRHPSKFTCLAARQGNFSSKVLDPGLVSRSQHVPIMVVYTENDMGICKEESQQAVQWYEAHGYSNFGWVKLKNLGHVRTPDLAAEFFGRTAGVSPTRPPAVLRNRQALAGNAKGMQFMGGGPQPVIPPVASAAPRPVPAADVVPVRNAPSNSPAQPPAPVAARQGLPDYQNVRGVQPEQPAPARDRVVLANRESRNWQPAAPVTPPDARLRPAPRNDDVERERRERRSRERIFGEWPLDESTRPIMASSDSRGTGPSRQTPPRTAGAALEDSEHRRYDQDSAQPVAIRVSSAIGIEPLSLGYWADCPRDWQRSAEFLWTLDGKPIGSGINGQQTLADAGDHTLGLTVTLRDGQQFRTSRRIRVLSPAPSHYYSQARRQ